MMAIHRQIWLAALLGCAACVSTALAQDTAPAKPAEVLVLGLYHFGNPGLDVVKTEIADMLSVEKQAEIAAVIDGLARFEPTAIAVEQRPETADRLDARYQAYRAGEEELTRNERQQLGFRLAAQFEHERLHPIDYRNDFPFGPLMQYAQEHDPEFVAFINAEIAQMEEESNRRQRENTVAEILRIQNDPEMLAESHGVYMHFNRVGAGDTNVGADLLAKWYERNIRIFANIQALARPGERVLVFIGAGHAPILRELVAADPELVLVDPLEYLPEK